MNILQLSWKNMVSRPLSMVLSLVLLALGVGMIALLLQVSHHVQTQMTKNMQGIDMVVGAKGSPLQLILSAVFHIDAPTGNISWKEARQLQRNRLVGAGIPLSYGDTYAGYRIVGTDHRYPALYDSKVATGKLWERPFEVTLGATVAKDLGLQPGDTFTGSHGLMEGGETHDEHAYQVAGVFARTYSVLDQLILTATESVWNTHHHAAAEAALEATSKAERHDPHHHEHEDESAEPVEEDQEITAMLVKFRNPLGMVQLPRMVNENTNMQSAVPVYEINRLFSLMGVGIDTLRTIALVIMVISGLSVFISLYNALRDRRYEMALMRTYGASRQQLVVMVLQEGVLLALTGFILGMILSRVGMWLVERLMQERYGYGFSGWYLLPGEWQLLLITLGIGILSALLPAIQAFSINISKTLADA